MYVFCVCTLSVFRFSGCQNQEPFHMPKKKVKLKTATLFFLVLAVDFGSSRTKKLN